MIKFTSLANIIQNPIFLFAKGLPLILSLLIGILVVGRKWEFQILLIGFFLLVLPFVNSKINDIFYKLEAKSIALSGKLVDQLLGLNPRNPIKNYVFAIILFWLLVRALLIWVSETRLRLVLLNGLFITLGFLLLKSPYPYLSLTLPIWILYMDLNSASVANICHRNPELITELEKTPVINLGGLIPKRTVLRYVGTAIKVLGGPKILGTAIMMGTATGIGFASHEFFDYQKHKATIAHDSWKTQWLSQQETKKWALQEMTKPSFKTLDEAQQARVRAASETGTL